MQIKRYEAADMAEALRMVKREFGDNAVILSAKEVRPGGFFSALRKPSVEITAAADYPDNGQAVAKIPANNDPITDERMDRHPTKARVVDARRANGDFSDLLSTHLEDESQNDRVSLSTLAMTDDRSVDERQAPVPQKQMMSARVKSNPLSTVHPEAGLTQKAASTRDVENDDLVAAPFYREAGGRKIIALVGAPGVGKSTTLAKLARHCQRIEKKRVGLISLDRFRMAANGMLDHVAQIMDLALTIVHDADHLRSALDDLADADVVFIDTPGVGVNDSSMMTEIGALLHLAKPHEIHLVLNATLRDDLLAAGVKHFLSLAPDKLLFTHMDEYGRSETVANLLRQSGLPSAFYGDGIDLFDHLHEMTVDKLVGFGPRETSAHGRLSVLPTMRERRPTASTGDDFSGDSIHYLANRNSELFHQPTCRSVKEINTQHITSFNSIEQAMQTGLKPCRACCDIDTITQSVTAASGHQHVRAI